nr:hypothetical protein BgiMline_021137 [Biomphalaria glabrata]
MFLKMQDGGIAGIVIAVVAAIIIFAVIVICYLNKKKKGDFLLEEVPETSMKIAYTNKGATVKDESVNVIDYTEIPFKMPEPAPRREAEPSQKHQQPAVFSNGTLRLKITEDGDYATIGTRVSMVVMEPPSRELQSVPENAEIMHAVQESDFYEFEGDYATLDSVAKKRLEMDRADDKQEASHVTVIQVPLENNTDKENECEYATVVPRSLRRKNVERVVSGVHHLNSDQSTESSQPIDHVATSQQTENEHF